jgi:hypothetical protein
MLELSDKQWTRQTVPLAEGKLCQLDVRLRQALRKPAPQRILWQLEAVDSAGQRTVLESGSAEIDLSKDPMFARLRFEPLAAPAGSTLELALRKQTAQPALLPLYNLAQDPAKSGLQLFAYFTQ